MGPAGLRRGRRGADDLHGGGLAAVRCRVVRPDEAERLAPRLAELHLAAMRSGMALGLVDPVDPAELAASYRASIAGLDADRRVVVVAELEGAVVGMAHLAPSDAPNATHRAEVQRVAVAPQARGSGVGRALMTAIEDEARVRGLTLLWLTTHAGADAASFYERIGYTELGVMPDYSRRPDGTLVPGAFYYRRIRLDR